jgi:hypothetical protein
MSIRKLSFTAANAGQVTPRGGRSSGGGCHQESSEHLLIEVTDHGVYRPG